MKLKTVDIGSVCFETSQRDPQREPDKEFIYIDIASIDNQAKRISGAQRLVGKNAPSRARKEIRSGDVLVSTVRPNLNAVALVPRSLDGQIASTGFCVLRPNPELIDSLYLFYRTTTAEFVDYVSMRVTGANYPAVSDTVVKSARIPLPLLSVQKQIAGILEKADAARNKRRQAKKLAEQFLQSAFLEMFGDPVTNPKGWEVRPLPEVVFFQEGPGIRKWQFQIEGTKLINVRNIVDGQLDPSNTSRYVDDDLVRQKYSHFLLDEHDLVLASSGVTWGKVAEVLKHHLPLMLNTSMIRVRPLNASVLNRQYLRSFLVSISFKSQIDRIITGSAQPNFGSSHLRQVKLVLPPISEQQKFATMVEEVESLRAKQRESEKELENLFQSLMQRAFRGELIQVLPSVSIRQNKVLSSTDLHAGILGKIILAHQAKPEYLPTLGHVKGEKTCHIIENVLNRDFGRRPRRLAAGPVDFKHLQGVEHRARMTKWFFTTDRKGVRGKEYSPGKNLNYLMNNLLKELDEVEVAEVARIIDLFVPMKTEHAEVVATVYSAWNDLLLDGKSPSDEEIVQEARENWTPEKMGIDQSHFFSTIKWLRRHNIVPKGQGKQTIR